MKNPPFAESGRKKKPAENVSRPFVPSADRTAPDAATAAIESGKHATQIQFAIFRRRVEGRSLDEARSFSIGPMMTDIAACPASSESKYSSLERRDLRALGIINGPFVFLRSVCDRN